MRDDSVLMAKLSVNVNKVATLRNSRGGHLPSVIEAVRVCVDAGAPGITVHPRADERHIRRQDVIEIADELAPLAGVVEFNIEGDPRPDLVELVLGGQPDQCTLVPVLPGEITSQAGWSASTSPGELSGIIDADEGGRRARQRVRRSGAGPDPLGPRGRRRSRRALHRAVRARVRAWARCRLRPRSSSTRRAARLAHELGLGVNAGHDLDLRNLTVFHALPHLDEVSIGHALIGHALYVGLRQVGARLHGRACDGRHV